MYNTVRMDSGLSRTFCMGKEIGQSGACLDGHGYSRQAQQYETKSLLWPAISTRLVLAVAALSIIPTGCGGGGQTGDGFDPKLLDALLEGHGPQTLFANDGLVAD